MAFLDNSGDIILDAVLTDTGRKRMADGTFAIKKFSLGDDEINYQLYNKSHPSGSAYYDLEILQTPVREATTKAGDIDWGLLDITNLNLLYLPAIKSNPGVASSRPADWSSPFGYTGTGPVFLRSGVYYLAANLTTYELFIGTDAVTGVPQPKERLDGTISTEPPNFLLIETGIDSVDVTATADARSSYITHTGMLDTTFTVSANSLFIVGVKGIQGISSVTNANPGGSETITANIQWNGSTTSGTSQLGASTYKDFQVMGGADTITLASKYSVIAGPRGTFTALQLMVAGELGSTTTIAQNYYNYGKVNQNLFLDGKTYDYIDTIVYVRGDQSGASQQLPIRIIRQNS